MPFDRIKANEYLEPVRDMGFGSESKRSLNQQQSSKLVKEKAQLPRANSRLKNQGQLIAKKGSAYPFANLSGEEGQDQICSNFIHSKSLGDCQGQPHKGKSAKEDELVRYMSNLPGYLQRVDSGESLQEKAFNVGVLDWARLEKWKHHQKHIPIISGNDGSSTGTSSLMKTNTRSSALSSAVPKDAAVNKGKQHRLNSSSLRSHKDGLFRGAKPSTEKVRHFQDIETASKSSLDQQKKISKTYESIDTTSSDVNFEKEKKKELNQKITSEMGNTSSNMGNHEVSPFPKEFASVSDGGAKNRVEKRQDIDADKKDLDKKNTSEAELSSSISRDYDVLLGSRKTSSAEGDKIKKKEARGSEIDLARQISPGKRKNIILLLPRSARNSFHEERQELLDGTLDQASRNSFSYDLLQKVRCGEPCSEVPHSCPLSSGIEMNPETLGVEPSSGASYGSACSNNSGSLRSEGNCSAERKIKSQDADVEALKILEEEMAELATRNSRTTSPNRRFSFSLSRMSRSFSFKEGSNVPLLSSNYVSVKSGPVRPDSSGFLDDTNRVKVNGHNRTRSSPLRRMLDPLLKSRGLSSFRFTDTVQPSKQTLNPSTPRPVNSNESLQEEKCDSSMIPALLQLTIKNGLPLFRFVVDNGSNMLATTMKSLAPSAKGGPGLNYIFSSVSEIKKKSGSWISHGNKEKNCGFIYNIIGQMKISSSNSSDFTAQDPSNQYLVRESVLFGVEQRQADQASGKFTPNTELAAVIIKMPGDGTDVELSDKDIQKKGFTECLAMDECSFNSMANAGFDSTTVILPGGVHSLPNKGIPSPLIDRWKSGGLCDCGGWDVGCKLRILSNEKKRCCKVSRTCQACLNPNRLELYAQGEAQNSRPIFSLVPHKNGIYAIEFSSPITALQAFFISVTVISCQTSSDLPEGKVIKDTMLNGSHGMETKPTIVLTNVPAKYAPNPPHSPVGRV
ncbi:hypothetical protein COLO4_14665 [Corchorus olitorius]|uniref:Uncharacterized protein n=1 Tax=Corchorus olitorius TaxID=93759 RepID=A0A1R3JRN9_9ROSI|nr:hypothetical protein COLO4_14665 [Corchorus olitorius]